jgi:hypothetical protein
VPTIVVAALGIPDSLTATDLLGYLEYILLRGFLDRKVQVCSYAADGTGTERNVQKLFTTLALDYKVVTIKHPQKGRPDIISKIPLRQESRWVR